VAFLEEVLICHRVELILIEEVLLVVSCVALQCWFLFAWLDSALASVFLIG
jgi:hypothetical protein